MTTYTFLVRSDLLVPGVELLLGPLLQLPAVQSAEGGFSPGAHMAAGQDPVLQGLEAFLGGMASRTVLGPFYLEQMLMQVGWQRVVEEVDLGLVFEGPLRYEPPPPLSLQSAH